MSKTGTIIVIKVNMVPAPAIFHTTTRLRKYDCNQRSVADSFFICGLISRSTATVFDIAEPRRVERCSGDLITTVWIKLTRNLPGYADAPCATRLALHRRLL
ncbi:MAG: hypothetical protein R2756_15930 [Bacteroidales bacterium]